MFRERIAKMLKSDNPISNIGKKSFDLSQVEEVVEKHDAKCDEVPDFSKVLKEKGLTKDEKHATMDDSDLAELKALKMLIEKYKREK